MTVETGINFISELNENYPRSGDLLKEGDDHIRLVKAVLKYTLPNFDRKVEINSTSLNNMNKNTTFDTDSTTYKSEVFMKKVLDLGEQKIQNVAPPTEKKDVVTKEFLESNAQKASWPVNSIFMTMENKNPSEIFGFGTWAAFAAGRVIIGAGTNTDTNNESRTFTAGEYAGAYKHTLISNELPSHSHGHNFSGTATTAGSHRHGLFFGGGSSGPRRCISIDTYHADDHEYMGNYQATQDEGSHTHPVTISGTIGATGTNTPHNNMQPYLAVYIWRRTA